MSKNNTHIRHFSEADIPWIIESAKRELPKQRGYEGITVAPDRIEFLLNMAIKDESAFIVHLLCDSHNKPIGMISASCLPVLFSWDAGANEITHFIEEEYRTFQNYLKIIRSYKDWAIRRNAKIIRLSYTTGEQNDAFIGMLKNEGFQYIGGNFQLERS